MKLLIDCSNLYAGGGLQVSTSFLNDLKELNLNHKYYIVQSKNFAQTFTKTNFPNNFEFYELEEKEEKSIRIRKKAMLEIEHKISPDCIFTVFGPSYHKSKFPKIVGFAIPFIVYPDSPFFNLISSKEKLKYRFLALVKSYFFKKHSDALIFETENARKKFIKISKYKNHSFTVGNTLNEIFSKKEKWNNNKVKTDQVFNILFLTANYKHKNIDILPKVIKILKSKYSFTNFKVLVTLNETDTNFDYQTNENIIYLNNVNISEIPNLYQVSDIVFIPTLLEVFSATYLEAMFMKKPIISSDMEFSRDICGDSAYFCKPIDPEEYAKAIFELASNENLRNDLVNKGTENLKRFGSSMQRTKSYINILEQISNKYANNK